MRLENAMRIQAAAQDGTGPANRWGTVKSVNTTDMTAKVLIQPENVLSGWLPIISPMSGSGWGVLHPPVDGQQVLLAPDAGDHESYVILGASWSAAGKPPKGSKSGELWLVHSSGASVKLLNAASDQTVMVAIEASGSKLTMLNTGHVVLVDQSGTKVEMTNDGKATFTGELDVTGDIHVTGDVTAGIAAVSLLNHIHPFGAGTTGPPVGGGAGSGGTGGVIDGGTF